MFPFGSTLCEKAKAVWAVNRWIALVTSLLLASRTPRTTVADHCRKRFLDYFQRIALEDVEQLLYDFRNERV